MPAPPTQKGEEDLPVATSVAGPHGAAAQVSVSDDAILVKTNSALHIKQDAIPKDEASASCEISFPLTNPRVRDGVRSVGVAVGINRGGVNPHVSAFALHAKQ